MKTASLQIVMGLLVLISITSCSRKLNLDYAGHYKPHETPKKSMDLQEASQQMASASEEQPVAVLSIPAREIFYTGESIQETGLTTRPVETKDWKPAERQQTRAYKTLEKLQAKVETRAEKKALKNNQSDQSQKRGTNHQSSDDSIVLLAILAILLPPLAVYLYEDDINTRFWISLILTLCFWIPGVIYALVLILGGM